MKNKYVAALALIVALFVTACGSKDDNSLEGKKAKLAELQTEQASIAEKIKNIQDELGVLEPNNDIKIVNVKAMPLVASNFQHFVEASGRLEAENNVFVTPQMGGALTSVKVREGDYVKKGQVVATIDNSILRNSIQEIEIQLSTAKILFDKQSSLWDQKIGTEIQYIQAKTQVESLEKRIQTLKSQDAMNVVKSPIDGYVDEVRMKVGEMASPGLGILRVVNFNELKVVANIPDTYAGTIKKGDIVKVRFPDLDKEVNTKLRFVSQTVNPVTRTFTAEATIPRVDSQLKPNLTAIVEINDQSKSEVIVIPRNLIQRTDIGDIVYVAIQENGKNVARSREVSTGLSYDGNIEIVSGLSSGDVIITDGYQDLVDGTIIEF
ncbi:RND family efflux transporter, MFP subunit [Spirosomataceae bacterium TFI 002]|nr:RND family efflux transporter, MFP subunit [Spirosomataceae bacterium TFI 002]